MLCFGRSEAVLIVARVLQGISAAVVWTVGIAFFRAIRLTCRTNIDRRHGSRGKSWASYGICVFSNVNWPYSWSRSRWDRLRSVRVLRSIWSRVWIHWTGSSIASDTCGEEDCCAIYYSVSQHGRRESRVYKVATFTRRNRRPPRRFRGARRSPSTVTCGPQSAESGPSDYSHPQVSSSSCGLVSVVCPGFNSLGIRCHVAAVSQRSFWLHRPASRYQISLAGLISGLVYMAVAIPVFFISPVAGWLCDRSGPKVPAVGGLVFSVPFLVLLQIPHASTDDQTVQVVILCVILALLGT